MRNLVDANTIIGTPIETASGTTLIPVSKISVGLATGGLDGSSTHPDKPVFGGGGGTGRGGGGGTEGGSGGINWNPDFDRLTDRDLRLVILLTAVTVLSLLIMGGYIFGKKN